MSKRKKGIEPQSFEQHFQALEQIVARIEVGQLDLSESLEMFETGLAHLRQCHERLREAEQRIATVARVDEQGRPQLEAWSPEAHREEAAGKLVRPEESPGEGRPPPSDGLFSES